ncbi:hypothetical protein [Shigella sp. FC1655]|uniref:hypothetical protein n=1 Tax=Shigella sp. FC1655 TaxID=1898038 RepID=UPI002570E6F7|nr:hypothetical protein [Shigella sp. FC1655]
MKNLSLFIFILILPTLAGCDSAEKKAKKEAETYALRQSSFENMVDIKGGRFQMGDFGDLVALKIQYSTDQRLNRCIG